MDYLLKYSLLALLAVLLTPALALLALLLIPLLAAEAISVAVGHDSHDFGAHGLTRAQPRAR
jgi:hypothetical protein